MDRTGRPSFDLTGKVAMVTGSARGIGFAIASALAAYGADIVLCDLLADELEESRKAIADLGRRALAVRVDVTKIPEIQAMVGRAVEEFGRVDILVNNAGINITQWAVDVTEEAWDKVMNINLKAVFFCSQAVARVMIGRRAARSSTSLPRPAPWPFPSVPLTAPARARLTSSRSFSPWNGRPTGSMSTQSPLPL